MKLVLRGCAIALLTIVVAGCVGQRFIDGIPVGAGVDYDPMFVDFAIATLDDEDPGHAPVDGAEMFLADYRTPDGSKLLWTRSGGNGEYVVALHLSDDTVRAYFVWCGAGLDQTRCFLAPPDLVP